MAYKNFVFDGIVKAISDHSILFNYEGDDYWIPVKLIEESDYDWKEMKGKEVEVTIPMWIAHERGMI